MPLYLHLSKGQVFQCLEYVSVRGQGRRTRGLLMALPKVSVKAPDLLQGSALIAPSLRDSRQQMAIISMCVCIITNHFAWQSQVEFFFPMLKENFYFPSCSYILHLTLPIAYISLRCLPLIFIMDTCLYVLMWFGIII